jgi:pyrimidine deaminase RibD-like protein
LKKWNSRKHKNCRQKLGGAIEKSQRHQVQRNAMVGQVTVRSKKNAGIGWKDRQATKHTGT